MIEILTVCTGNICRSPLAEHLLRSRLADLDPVVASAGTRGLARAPMPPPALQLAADLGIEPAVSAAHRSRFLTEIHLIAPDLVLTMTRDHRRHVAELAPTRLRTTFTVRELARLLAGVTDDDLRAAARAGRDDGDRVRAAAHFISTRRGLLPPPEDPDADDVIDPFGGSWDAYRLSAAQLLPAIDAVERLVRVAATS
jgi:protein-tyrosine phosphatase